MTEPSGRQRRVVLYGNPALRIDARVVTAITEDVRQLMADLKATVLAREGLGLAANQLAEPVAVFALNPRGADQDREPYCVINPKVVATEGKVEAEEGCLSLPEVYDFLARPEFVRIAGLNEQGREVTVEARGLLARAVMHEIEHLDGVLFVDHLSPTRHKMLASRLKELEIREAESCR